MITIKMDESDALDLLMERLAYWTDDNTTTKLFESMYENFLDNGCFDGVEFDVMEIVDNDYVN